MHCNFYLQDCTSSLNDSMTAALKKAVTLPALELPQDNPENQYCCVTNGDNRNRGSLKMLLCSCKIFQELLIYLQSLNFTSLFLLNSVGHAPLHLMQNRIQTIKLLIQLADGIRRVYLRGELKMLFTPETMQRHWKSYYSPQVLPWPLGTLWLLLILSKRKKTLGMMEQSLKQALYQDTECWNLWKLHDTQNCTLGNFVPHQKTWFPSHNCIWIARCLEGGSYPVPNKIISFDTKNCTQEGSLNICWTISISAAILAQFRMKQLWADWQAKWT